MTYVSQPLRRQIIERASGCCEYCRLHQDDSFLPFEIDHIIAEKHNGETIESNLCWSCYECNGYKGSDIGSIDSVTGALTPLFNPCQQVWIEHFRLNSAIIEPLTPEGRVTVFLLKLNLDERAAQRSDLINLQRYPCGTS